MAAMRRRKHSRCPRKAAFDVVSFDGASADEAAAARGAMTQVASPDMMWLPVIGLDRHTPMIGLRVLRDSPNFK